MPIIHNLTDRQTKKFKIKTFAIILISIGVLLILSIILKPKQISQPQEISTQSEKKTYFCLNIDNTKFVEDITKYTGQKKINLEVVEDSNEGCEIDIARNVEDTNQYTIASEVVYLFVSNFKSKLDNISSKDIVTILNTQKYNGSDVIWNSQTDNFLRSKFSFGVGQTVYSDSEIVKKIVTNANTIAIVPFDNVDPRYKIVSIDNFDIFSKNFLTTIYPLTDSYWYKSSSIYKDKVGEIISTILPKTNYNNSNFTTITLTGSSFISADKYSVYINNGEKSDYMVKNIEQILKSSDISHVSNEVSIVKNCIQKINSSYLCTFEKDLSVLKTLGVDVVGVSGNHIMDFGYNTFINTLNWYNSNKITYFGGGINLNDARTPKVVKTNNLKASFLGYNYIPPFSYYATKNKGGSSNVSHAYLKEDITKSKKLSDITIVDMNWSDEQQTTVDNGQITEGEYALKTGATIVNGVNSYKPLGFKIYSNRSIFYGLGGFINPYSKEGLIVQHIFYGKKYFNIHLIPIVYDSKGRIQLAEGNQKDRMFNSLYKQSSIIYD